MIALGERRHETQSREVYLDALIRLGVQAGNKLDVDEPLLVIPGKPKEQEVRVMSRKTQSPLPFRVAISSPQTADGK